MKLVTFVADGEEKIGGVVETGVVDLTAVAPDMLTFIDAGDEALRAARQHYRQGAPITLSQISLLAPIPRPRRNIVCLGLNYAEHAAESYTARGREVNLPEVPIVFTKATTAVIGPEADIPYNPQVSTQIDWEVELAVIIGREGKNIPAERAFDHIFGYTILNDISARDLQRQGKQYFKGKSLDGACPLGPWITTLAAVPDPHQLTIRSRVNGQLKQDSNTRHMIFDIPAIIAYLSRGMTLLPGDIIATGTPEGVGFARTPPEFLGPGDMVTCEIEGLGLLQNRIAGQA